MEEAGHGGLELGQQLGFLLLELGVGQYALLAQRIELSEQRRDVILGGRQWNIPVLAAAFQAGFGVQHGGLEFDRVIDALEQVDAQLAGGQDLDVAVIENAPQHALRHLDIVDLVERGNR